MATRDILGLDPSSASSKAARKAAAAAPTGVAAPQPPAEPPAMPKSSKKKQRAQEEEVQEAETEQAPRRKTAAAPTAAGPGAVSSSRAANPNGADGPVRAAPSSNPSRRSTAAAPFDRDSWTSHQLSLRADQFVQQREVSILATTWNVNAKGSWEEESLAPWLLRGVQRSRGGAGERQEGEEAEGDEEEDEEEDDADDPSLPLLPAPDLYVIGLQEIVDLSDPSNLVMDSTASMEWEDRIESTLARIPQARYYRVSTVHLVGLSMVVYARGELKRSIADVRACRVGVGLMGMAGNKGAVILRMRVHGTQFTFVNSHLAAHQGAVQARNNDWWSIIRGTHLGTESKRVRLKGTGEWVDRPKEGSSGANGKGSGGGAGAAASAMASSASNFLGRMAHKGKALMDGSSSASPPGASSSSSDLASPPTALSPENLALERDRPDGLFCGSTHVLWLGDVNYRLDVVELGMDGTHALIEAGRYGALMKLDQLTREKRARRTFLGFVEPVVTFPPTYKFIAGTDTYDRRPEKKVRYPAYTDRIQLMTRRAGWVANAESLGLDPSALESGPYIRPAFYMSAPGVVCSDHKPVLMRLDASVWVEDREARRAIVEELDKWTDEECQRGQ